MIAEDGGIGGNAGAAPPGRLLPRQQRGPAAAGWRLPSLDAFRRRRPLPSSSQRRRCGDGYGVTMFSGRCRGAHGGLGLRGRIALDLIAGIVGDDACVGRGGAEFRRRRRHQLPLRPASLPSLLAVGRLARLAQYVVPVPAERAAGGVRARTSHDP
jgi:hypothetical protein